MKDDAKAKVREAKEKVRSKADDLKDDAREKARDVRDEAERKAQHWASAAGERTGSLSRALRAAADSLRDEGEPGMADLAGRAAEQVERMSGYLEDEDPSAMLHDLEDMGRRNPGTFVGSTFAMGLLLGRFLRSSSPGGDGASAQDGGSPTGRVPTAAPTTDRYASPRTGPTYGGASSGQDVRTGSAGASSAGAGSAATHRVGGEDRAGGTTKGSGSSRPGGNPQSSGSPTSGTGAPTGDRKEDESDER